MDKKKFATVDQYIASFPKHVQTVLQKIRRTIRKAAPGAEETISYQIPTFKLDGRSLVYFAGWKDHVSLYPIPKGTAAFHKSIARYQKGKGTLRFSLDEPVPYRLVEEIATLHRKERAKQNPARPRKSRARKA
jgi:uncharacterized protein YdhG (YjbR/CyaY superfamily)